MVTHWLPSLHSRPDIFQGNGTIKWIYYACEVLYTLPHAIVAMELSPGQLIFWYAETVFGSLGFELILWTSTSHAVWASINVCITIFALSHTTDGEFMDLLRKTVQPLDGNPFSEVQLDMMINVWTEDDVPLDIICY